jgi:hypothetical protein
LNFKLTYYLMIACIKLLGVCISLLPRTLRLGEILQVTNLQVLLGRLP